MAKLKGILKFEGSLGDITAYKRRDLAEVILRTKGGATKEKINTEPQFEKVRRNNSEFKGSAKAASAVIRALKPIADVNDYNYMGQLTALMKLTCDADTVNEQGTRSILLSAMPQLLSGMQLNQRNAMENVLRTPLNCIVSKQDLAASIEYPAIMPGINFKGIGTFPLYRWVAVMALVPDFYLDEVRGYVPANELFQPPVITWFGDWQAVNEKAVAGTIDLSIPGVFDTTNCSLVVAAGISFGLNKGTGNIRPVKGAGCGKVL